VTLNILRTRGTPEDRVRSRGVRGVEIVVRGKTPFLTRRSNVEICILINAIRFERGFEMGFGAGVVRVSECVFGG
jgi:hypothetical protein